MPYRDDAADARAHRARLRHGVLTPLTAIRARSQMVDCAVRRSPSLAAGEREAMLAHLAGVAAILAAVDGAGDDARP
jgi:hypothetical protein